ncbi:5-methylcytosine-specific restriction endonuclease McrA [Cyclobacterium lianum]|uniref:5-methylcytosine-specific restriction endonuclease McrA n=2 Tax=Cyclobacterium lianum TaxID=388280 RepID=A0A1M7IRW4_9BACT|nr:5-methylcytosine-specific restriction endonuclease McrA [Cyclobacterium lianum]
MKEWMEKKVLVLNLDHSPVGVVNVQKALVLTLLDKASSLAHFDYLTIRTVDRDFPYPAVIRLVEYKSIPYKGVMLNRNNLYKRDQHSCQYCGTDKGLTLDHVVPRSKGGKTSWKNLVTACHRCNTVKGDKTPEQAGLKLKALPFKPTLAYFLAEYAERHAEEWLPFLAAKTVG